MATPNYTLPDWLKAAPDPGREYTAAFSAGAQIAQEKARLAQAAQEAAMAATTRMQIAQQDNLQTQQRIEIEKNYQQQQIGLRKQELDQAQQKVGLAATQAARRFAAQSQIKQAIASGMPADEAFLRFGSEAFGSAAGIAPLAKQVHERMNPFAPTIKELVGPSGQKASVVQTGPHASQVMHPTAPEQIQTVPVMGPDGKAREDMIGVPNAQGGVTVKTIKKADNTRRIEHLESGMYGPFLTGARQPSKGLAVNPAYLKAKAEYEMLTKPKEASPAVPETPFREGQKIRNTKTGKMFIVKDGIPVPFEGE